MSAVPRITELFKFQTQALKGLTDLVVNRNLLTDMRDMSIKILLWATTGAGKTVMAAFFARALSALIREKDNDYAGSVFVFLAPNTLHMQAFDRFRFMDLGLKLITGDDVMNYPNGFPEDSVVFLNYSSVNKDTNLLMQTNENGTSLPATLEKTRSTGKAVVLMVDEAHVQMAGQKNDDVIRRVIQPDLTVNITATPQAVIDSLRTSEKFTVRVDTKDVKAEFVIVDSTVVNDDLKKWAVLWEDEKSKYAPEVRAELDAMGDNGLYIYVAEMQRRRAEKAYRRERERSGGKRGNVNPATAIQLVDNVNGSDGYAEGDIAMATKKDAVESEKAKREALYLLEHVFGYTIANKKVAVWMADDKRNREEFEADGSDMPVLLFKAALAVGYDNVRIFSMALLRDMKSKAFAIQVVGRAGRMPELCYYSDDFLNHAYVNTEYSLVRSAVEQSDGEIETGTTATIFEGHRDVFESIKNVVVPTYTRHRKIQNGIPNIEAAKSAVDEGVTRCLDGTPFAFENLGFERKMGSGAGAFSAVLKDIDITDTELVTLRTGVQLEATPERARVAARAVSDGVTKSAGLNTARSRAPMKGGTAYLARMLYAAGELPVGNMEDAEFAFNRYIIGSPRNREAYETIFAEGIPIVMPDHDGELYSDPEPVTGGWSPPAEVKVLGEPLKHTPRLHLHTAMSGKFDSDAEKLFPEFTQLLESEGFNLRFWKLPAAGPGSLGVPYTDRDGKRRLFHPDWALVFIVHDESHLVFVETKSFSRSKPQPEEVSLRADAMARFVAENPESNGTSIHGAVVNMADFTADQNAHSGQAKVVNADGSETLFYNYISDLISRVPVAA